MPNTPFLRGGGSCLYPPGPYTCSSLNSFFSYSNSFVPSPPPFAHRWNSIHSITITYREQLSRRYSVPAGRNQQVCSTPVLQYVLACVRGHLYRGKQVKELLSFRASELPSWLQSKDAHHGYTARCFICTTYVLPDVSCALQMYCHISRAHRCCGVLPHTEPYSADSCSVRAG